jgi:glyoxylase-like metal-dependent hydrolase (beta-lactamase superfamily II)
MTAIPKPPEVGEGVYRLGTKWVNFYLVEDGGEFALIDAGYPGYWKHLVRAVEALGTRLEAIRAVILTHHHADPAGTAAQLRATVGAPVLVGAEDAWIVGGRYPSHANPGFYRQSPWRRSGLGFLAHSAVVGGAKYRPAPDVESLGDDKTLELPGRPRVIHTPGHTGGHRSVVLPDRGVFSRATPWPRSTTSAAGGGLDSIASTTTGRWRSPRLTGLDPIEAEVALVAHGDTWTSGLQRARDRPRERRHANAAMKAGHMLLKRGIVERVVARKSYGDTGMATAGT